MVIRTALLFFYTILFSQEKLFIENESRLNDYANRLQLTSDSMMLQSIFPYKSSIVAKSTTLYHLKNSLANKSHQLTMYSSIFERGFHSEPSRISLFRDTVSYLLAQVNLAGEAIHNKSYRTNVARFQYDFYGRLNPNLYFNIQMNEAIIFGNEKIALENSRFIKNNYYKQYLQKRGQNTTDYTTGYIYYDSPTFDFWLGKIPWKIGEGESGSLVLNGEQLAPFTSFGILTKLWNIRYQSFHATILATDINDSLSTEPQIADKFFVNHRFELELTKNLMLHYNESIIYGDRSLDLNYLNPFVFLRAQEHESQDRDNVLVSLGFKWRIPEFRIITYHDILLDEWRISEIFSNWFGNKHGILNGITWLNGNTQFWFEHVAIRPFTYTHRFDVNRYTHDGQNLGYFAGPNSQTFFTKAAYFPNPLWRFFGSYRYTTQGLNLPKSESTSWNVGGNIYEAHVNQNIGDVSSITETVSFLGGQTQVEKELILKLIYDHNHHISGEIQYINNSLDGNMFNMFFRIQY